MTTNQAYSILFEMDWGGNGPLFENQQELVLELIANPQSHYHITRATATEDELNKATGRLKTYISQLFTGNTKRNITREFKQSLLVLLQEKLPLNFAPDNVLSQIVTSLIQPSRKKTSHTTVQDWPAYNHIIEQWIKTTILDQPYIDDQYKLGQANGVRQGAMLIWSMIYPKNTEEDNGG